MRVLTAFSRGKGAARNLDRFVVTDDWVAVFDGVTPKSPDLDAATAATAALVDDLVAVVRSAAPDLDPVVLVDRLAEVAADHQGEHRPAAAGAVFSLRRRQVVVITDVWVSVDGVATFYGHDFETVVTQARRALTEAELAAGRSVDELRAEDPGRRAVHQLLVGEAALRNVDADGPYFYAALDGRPIPHRLLTVLDVPPVARTLCLASDGYPVLESTWEETEAALRRDLEADPLRIGPHGGPKALALGAESDDDRTFVLLDLSAGEGVEDGAHRG
jgi:hypothetical protein